MWVARAQDPDQLLENVSMTEHPMDRFARVFAEAEREETRDPNAMVISTVDGEGRPSSRVVLLKGFDRSGFVFYTNLESRKGTELAGNPNIALNFFWRATDKQVCAAGKVTRVSDAQADEYFASRQRGSRIGAWASRQSRPLESRDVLLAEVEDMEAQHQDGDVPRPPHWGGFLVEPRRIEFWTRGDFRLHDREVYERGADGEWTVSRLYP